MNRKSNRNYYDAAVRLGLTAATARSLPLEKLVAWVDSKESQPSWTVIVKVAGRPDQIFTGVRSKDEWSARTAVMHLYKTDAASGGRLNGAFVDYIVTPEKG
jgi:hypothetical protein